LSQARPLPESVAAVRIAFPRAETGQSEYAAANLVAWHPARPENARQRDELCDIAVLKVEIESPLLPPDVILRQRPPGENEPFVAWGFPGDSAGAPRVNGTSAKGEVIDHYAAGLVEIRGTEAVEYMLRPGFSGGPAFGLEGHLLGMVTQADRNDRRALLITSEHIARAWPPLGRPYQGFLAFTEETSRYFFGRQEETAELEALLARSRMIAVVGASGSGKSSLVQAGLVPRLRKNGWTVAAMRPGRDPLLALENALLPLGGTQSVTLDTLRRVAQAQRGHNLLLLVDQFEELWTQTPDEERGRFLSLLFEITGDGRIPSTTVFTLRSDFITPLLYDGRTRAVLQDAAYLLGPMTPASLRQAIIEPAGHFGIAFDDDLREQLVTDTLGSSSTGALAGRLPLLQFALAQLWELQDSATKRIPLTAYGEPPAALPRVPPQQSLRPHGCRW
jgi:hypothetical protein